MNTTYEYILLSSRTFIFVCIQHLGEGGQVLQDIIDGKHPFSKQFAAAKRPMVVVGSVALQRPDGAAIHSMANSIASTANTQDDEWKVMNVLHRVCKYIQLMYIQNMCMKMRAHLSVNVLIVISQMLNKFLQKGHVGNVCALIYLPRLLVKLLHLILDISLKYHNSITSNFYIFWER